jgi:hypothetical protein
MPNDTPAPAQLLEQLQARYPHTTPADREPTGNRQLAAALSTVKQIDGVHQLLLDRLADTDGRDELVLSARDAALLAWVDEAFRIAFRDTAVDSQLSRLVLNWLPVAAAVAITDQQFLLIGEHPLQKLLDAVHSQCMGWHPDLGRAGTPLLSNIETISQQARQYFENPQQGFAAITDELQEFMKAESLSFSRTQERVIETEHGRLKAMSARVTAGRAINDFMQGKQFPEKIFEFLHGSWFDSLQLLLILHGPESEQWSRALLVTDTLIWTVQPIDLSDEDRRQRLYKVIPKIPRELRQLLISLEYDAEAAEAALATVEDIHIRLLRNRPPDFVSAEPIDLGPVATRTRVSQQMLQEIETLKEGQWFLIKKEKGEVLRIRLALKMDDYGQLLFVNRLGAKTFSKSFEEFAYLLNNVHVRLLPSQSGFSHALVLAAGLEPEDELPAAEPAPQRVPEPTPAPEPTPDPDLDLALEPLSDLTPEPVPEPTPDPVPDPTPDPVFELAPDPVPDPDPIPAPAPAPAPEPASTATPKMSIESISWPSPTRPEEISTGNAVLDQISIGSWVLFKDQEEAILCKLAVRIADRDMYLFVNNRGKRERELNRNDLLALIESDALELIEEKSSFEDAVSGLVRNFRDEGLEEEQE